MKHEERSSKDAWMRPACIGALSLSTLGMLILLWLYPKKTLIVSFLFLVVLSASAALSRTAESDSRDPNSDD